MFRWNGGSASFRKRLLRKMPDKSNKVIVSKYFTKNQNSKKCEINYQNKNEDRLDFNNGSSNAHTIISSPSSENYKTEQTKNYFSNESNADIMIESSELESCPLTINTTDILMVDPSYMKILSLQNENKNIYMKHNTTITTIAPLIKQLNDKQIESKNDITNNLVQLNDHFSISNHIIFNKIVNYCDIQTQTAM